MVLVRDVSKLSSIIMLATLFMLSTILVVLYFGGQSLLLNGQADGIVYFIKPDSCLVFIGMGAFLFGKIGLIIPMRDIMQEKQRFTGCMYASLWSIFGIFSTFGLIGYLAFGYNEKMANGGGMVTLALDQSNVVVQVTELAFMVSLIPSCALMLYVPVKIWENAFYKSWPRSCARTWWKNLWRVLAVAAICYLAIATQKTFDKVMALFGSLFGGPTTYLWPAVFHLILASHTWKQKLWNWGLIIFGILASGFTLFMTIKKLTA
jgi:proton-coupled amino acid transporter